MTHGSRNKDIGNKWLSYLNASVNNEAVTTWPDLSVMSSDIHFISGLLSAELENRYVFEQIH
jgi:hypothetical protein